MEYFLAILLGSLAAKLTDPVSWILLAAVILAGFLSARAFWPAIGAVVATALTVASVYSWWKELGVAHWQQRAMWMFFLYAVIAYAGFGIGLLVRRIAAKPSN